MAETAHIISIRDALSPHTRIDIDEVGAIADSQPCCPFAEMYWNLAGATYAYLYGKLGALGVDVLGERCVGVFLYGVCLSGMYVCTQSACRLPVAVPQCGHDGLDNGAAERALLDTQDAD